MKNYLIKVGLEEFAKNLSDTNLNEYVSDAFSENYSDLSISDVKKLYLYDVPKLGENGSCSLTHEKEDKPYNLAETLGLNETTEDLKNDPQTIRIWRLNRIVKKVMESVSPDWLGIYRKIVKKDKEEVLVKEAYAGAFSRAEFPLNAKFAEQSNNSMVGLTGKARYFEDLLNYDGPYYECDNKVQSEYCGPILNENGHVIGIVDAESFQKDFFTPEKILQLTKICQDIGKINFGIQGFW